MDEKLNPLSEEDQEKVAGGTGTQETQSGFNRGDRVRIKDKNQTGKNQTGTIAGLRYNARSNKTYREVVLDIPVDGHTSIYVEESNLEKI